MLELYCDSKLWTTETTEISIIIYYSSKSLLFLNKFIGF